LNESKVRQPEWGWGLDNGQLCRVVAPQTLWREPLPDQAAGFGKLLVGTLEHIDLQLSSRYDPALKTWGGGPEPWPLISGEIAFRRGNIP
jgi:hypothetical protein